MEDASARVGEWGSPDRSATLSDRSNEQGYSESRVTHRSDCACAQSAVSTCAYVARLRLLVVRAEASTLNRRGGGVNDR